MLCEICIFFFDEALDSGLDNPEKFECPFPGVEPEVLPIASSVALPLCSGKTRGSYATRTQ